MERRLAQSGGTRHEAGADRFDHGLEAKPLPDKAVLLSLAQDLPSVWNSPTADMRLKQRIVRILVHEIVADVDEERSQIVLLIHWTGGRHSELRVKKNATEVQQSFLAAGGKSHKSDKWRGGHFPGRQQLPRAGGKSHKS